MAFVLCMTMISDSLAETTEEKPFQFEPIHHTNTIKDVEDNYPVKHGDYIKEIKFYGKRFMGSVLESLKPIQINFNS